MTKPLAKLVYDPDSGKLVYDPDSGKLVYACFAENHQDQRACYVKTSSQYPPTFAQAVSEMQTSVWNLVAGIPDAIQMRDPPYCVAGCAKIDCRSVLDGNNVINVVGEHLLAVKFTIALSNAASWAWKVGWATSNDATPDPNWTNLSAWPFVTNTTAGNFRLPVDADLLTYLYLFIAMNPYTAPTGSELQNAAFADDSIVRLFF